MKKCIRSSMMGARYSRTPLLSLLLSAGACAFASAAQAQEEPAATTTETAPPPETPVDITTAEEMREEQGNPTGDIELRPRAADEPTSAEVVEERPAEEAPAADAHPLFAPSVTIGSGMRTGLVLAFPQNFGGRTETVFSLQDGTADQLNLRPFISGTLNEWVSAFMSLELGTTQGSGIGISVLDAIIQVRFLNEFQVWIGQHIPANDRNNMNGPFFTAHWNHAIDVQGYPFDTGARDRGLTFWGLVGGGVFKYHASVVDLQPGRAIQNARYAARITFHFLEPENFYYNSGSYFGTKDVLAIGAALQYQQGFGGTSDVNRDGIIDNELFGFSFDAFFEKRLPGGAGTLTLEGGFWDFSQTGADYYGNQASADSRTTPLPAPGVGTTAAGTGVWGPYPGRSALAQVAYLTQDKIGIGHFQPIVRWQGGWYNTGASFFLGPYGGAPDHHVIDVGLGYIIDQFNHRWYLNYRHVENSGANPDDDQIMIGAQIFATMTSP